MTSEYGKVYNLQYTILRYGSIYGPRSNLKNGLLKIVYDAVKKRKLIGLIVITNLKNFVINIGKKKDLTIA